METFAPFPVDFITDNTLLNEDDPYFSLSQFDFELQQQAQAALQQESWQDFDKYLSLETDFNAPMMDSNSASFNDPSLLYAPLNLPEKKEEWPNNIKQEYGTPESIPYSPPLPQEAGNNQSPKLAHSTPSLNWSSEPQGKVPIQRLKQMNTVTNAVNAVLNNTMPGRQHKKTAHNAIERRYRNNINDRIAELKNAVPALLYAKVKDNRKRSHKNDEEDDGEDGEEFLDGVAVATKLNKATILRKATEYINYLKKTGQDLKQENEILQRILTQLPGGADILQRYHMQKQERDKELQRQQMVERELEKQQEQQRKAANRKRARYNKAHPSDEDGFSSSSSDPVTPPSRVFMAMFMAITLFSTSPLSSPSKHATKEAAPLVSVFTLDTPWAVIRLCVLGLVLFRWVLPYLRSWLFGSSLKMKRVHSRILAKDSPSLSPGDLRCQQMCAMLDRSGLIPKSRVETLLGLMKESLRLFVHHYLGYDILYEDEEGTQVYEWIKLNETLCLGGKPAVSRLTLLYTGLCMINCVHLAEEGHTRAYATAAMLFSLVVPQRALAERLAHYFWRLAAPELSPEPEQPMPESRAWAEILDVLQNQIQPEGGLSLSYSAPCLVPLQILTSLHWLDCLQSQFGCLITLLTEDEDDTEFDPILASIEPEQGLVHWLATVGAVVESVWKHDTERAEGYLESLARVPRSVTAASVAHKQELNILDERVKKTLVHTLVGAVYLQSDDAEKQKRGRAELELAHNLRTDLQLLQSKLHEKRHDLESTVLSLAECAVNFVGIEAWLNAMGLEDSDINLLESRIKESSLSLRRLLRHPYLNAMVQTKDILERLMEVNLFLEHSVADTDSACEVESSEWVKRAKEAQSLLHGENTTD